MKPTSGRATGRRSAAGRAPVAGPESQRSPKGRALVLGLGNPVLRDDGIGILVAREVERLIGGRPDVDVREASVAGFELLELLAGFERAILIDAIQTTGGEPGTVYRLLPDHLPMPKRLATSHEISLPAALVLGHLLGIEMPTDVVVFAIEVEDDRTFGETCSLAVAGAVENVVPLVIGELSAADGTTDAQSSEPARS